MKLNKSKIEKKIKELTGYAPHCYYGIYYSFTENNIYYELFKDEIELKNNNMPKKSYYLVNSDIVNNCPGCLEISLIITDYYLENILGIDI